MNKVDLEFKRAADNFLIVNKDNIASMEEKYRCISSVFPNWDVKGVPYAVCALKLMLQNIAYDPTVIVFNPREACASLGFPLGIRVNRSKKDCIAYTFGVGVCDASTSKLTSILKELECKLNAALISICETYQVVAFGSSSVITKNLLEHAYDIHDIDCELLLNISFIKSLSANFKDCPLIYTSLDEGNVVRLLYEPRIINYAAPYN